MSVPAKATGRTKKSAAWKSIKNNYMLYLFLVPALVYVAVFCYAPMYGVQIAFKNFKASKGIMGSAWVGLAHFKTFFSSPRFMLLLTNTLSVSVYSIIVGFPIPIILALLFNYVQYPWFKKFAQTVSYAPHFISTVVLVGMLSMFFSTTTGFVNTAIAALGFNKIHFFGEPQYFRHLYVWSGVWQNMGWSAVIYIATLSGVDPQQHEAARIDGCTDLMIFFRIVVPLSKPVIMVITLFTLNGVWSDFLWPYLTLTDKNLFTVMVKLYRMGTNYSIDKKMIAMTFAIIPPIILFAIFQKHIMTGFSLGGIKG